MATRQRTRSPSKAPSSSQISSPKISSQQQVSGTSTEERTRDSEVLRAGFDTTPFEERVDASDSTDAAKVSFVGEQLVYKDRDARVAEVAYLRAEQRGFWPGYELDDWLAAEKEVDALLAPDGNLDTK
jgi:hypothetical protein